MSHAAAAGRLVAALLALFWAPFALAEAFDPLIAREDLWKTNGPDFLEQNRAAGFTWISAAHDLAQTTQSELTLFDNRVYQVLARFEGGQLKQITVSLFNRGDAGEMPREKFEALLGDCVKKLTAFTKAPVNVRGKDAASAVKAEGVWWQNSTSKFLLEYSFTREVKTRNIPYRAEFMRLEITPVEKVSSLLTTALATTQKPAKFNAPAHVKHEPNGDVVLEGVPMVDQGDKGYCVVASTERVMRYYGGAVDEHELAQVANSSAEGGTSNEAMFDALKKLSARLHVKIRMLEEFDVKSLLELIKDYNRVARREHAAEIQTEGHTLDVQAIYGAMKPDLLRETRTHNKSEVNRFQRDVQARIDAGVPLLWSVMLGIVHEEKAPSGLGGHMRLIIGYNPKTNEIIYSDSWGLGHERKQMALADAWTITTGLNALEPL